VIPLALAIVFAFLLAPIVGLVERCRLDRVSSALVVLVLCFGLAALIGWGGTNQLMDILVHLSDYRANIHNKIEAVRAPGSGGLGKVTATVNDLSKELSIAFETAGNKKLSQNRGKEPIPVQVAEPPHSASEYLRDVVGRSLESWRRRGSW
jgi:predicted PurR-regulated permease PerM